MQFDYRHQVVRDLAWAIASPALLMHEHMSCSWYGDDWYNKHYHASLSWLQKVDANPDQLNEMLASEKDRRLGKYFETLWRFWLDQTSLYEVIEHNLPLRVNGETLGELDFIVLDKISGKYLHWELAIKFYLGVGDTTRYENWHGPGKKDRLDKKVSHLENRQSVICKNPVVKQLLDEKGIQIDACGVILKGRLFYPHDCAGDDQLPVNVNPEHLRSRWLPLSEFINQYSDNWQFRALVGVGWMASVNQSGETPVYDKSGLLDAIDGELYRLPLFVSCEFTGLEQERIFIVSDRWKLDLCNEKNAKK